MNHFKTFLSLKEYFGSVTCKEMTYKLWEYIKHRSSVHNIVCGCQKLQLQIMLLKGLQKEIYQSSEEWIFLAIATSTGT